MLNLTNCAQAYVGKFHLAGSGQERYRTRPVPKDQRAGYSDFWIASNLLEYTSHAYDGFMWDTDGIKRRMKKGKYRADFVGDCFLEFLQNRPSNSSKPFFGFVSFLEVLFDYELNSYSCSLVIPHVNNLAASPK